MVASLPPGHVEIFRPSPETYAQYVSAAAKSARSRASQHEKHNRRPSAVRPYPVVHPVGTQAAPHPSQCTVSVSIVISSRFHNRGRHRGGRAHAPARFHGRGLARGRRYSIVSPVWSHTGGSSSSAVQPVPIIRQPPRLSSSRMAAAIVGNSARAAANDKTAPSAVTK